jgi:creatinine amidohydrolase
MPVSSLPAPPEVKPEGCCGRLLASKRRDYETAANKNPAEETNMAKYNDVLVGEMSWPEYADRMKKNPVVMLPVGAIEQHGPHLPLSTDVIVPTEIAIRVARETGDIVLPAVNYGYRSMPKAGGGDRFPGTTNMDAATIVGQVRDIVREQVRHGARNFCMVVGHYENQWIVTEGIIQAMREVEDKGVRIMQLQYWDFLDNDTIERLFPGGLESMALEHAAVLETSMMMHLYPERVRLDLIPDNPSAQFPAYDIFPHNHDWVPDSGALTSAKRADAGKGGEIIEHYRRTISAAVKSEFK